MSDWRSVFKDEIYKTSLPLCPQCPVSIFCDLPEHDTAHITVGNIVQELNWETSATEEDLRKQFKEIVERLSKCPLRAIVERRK